MLFVLILFRSTELVVSRTMFCIHGHFGTCPNSKFYLCFLGHNFVFGGLLPESSVRIQLWSTKHKNEWKTRNLVFFKSGVVSPSGAALNSNGSFKMSKEHFDKNIVKYFFIILNLKEMHPFTFMNRNGVQIKYSNKNV